MKLTFLGTRGNIEARSRRHKRHSALLVTYHHTRLMIDCGADWRSEIASVAPKAILITHAHPDHAWGLADGCHCPVYATADTWKAIAHYPVKQRIEVKPGDIVHLQAITFRILPVLHSLRAPAVGYRISAGRNAIFYAPDVLDIADRSAALEGADIFIGDGASLTRPIVRRRDNEPFGHAPVKAQLGWCQEAGMTRALFTHCGSEIVEGDERKLAAKVRAMGREYGVDAGIAHDGMSIALR
jgi:phosphoribosyl 1,2-cyclic phosphodiesterase